MQNNFITNNGKSDLRTRLLELVENSEEMKFLVGFFYFSGVRELYQGLKNHPTSVLKILVGMNVDRFNYQLIEYGENNPSLSDAQRIEDFFGNIRTSLQGEEFDIQSFHEQIIFFLQLIREDRLIIRKTREPNHTKIYFFHDKDNVARKNSSSPAAATSPDQVLELKLNSMLRSVITALKKRKLTSMRYGIPQ